MPGHTTLNGGVAELVLSAGPIAKVVLSILALFSIICWALIVEKWWEFRRIRRDSQRFLRIFRDARRFSVVYGAAKKHRESPFAQLYLAAGQELASTLGGVEIVDRVLEESDEGVPPERLDAISRAMRKAAAAEVSRMERYLPFLATTASSAPFIGLFGTVWGIMRSFEGIAAAQSTSLAVVAPGIAEALFATAMGLAAAIPAVVAYNKITVDLGRFAGRMQGLIGRSGGLLAHMGTGA